MRTIPVKMVTTFFVGVTFVTTIYTMLVIGPYVEQRIMGPVVSKMRMINLREIDGLSVFDARFEKLRGCEFVGINWYRRFMDDDGSPVFERIPISLGRRPNDPSSPTRPLGIQQAGPWTVYVDNETLLNRSFARLIHRCHNLWVTTTDFYP